MLPPGVRIAAFLLGVAMKDGQVLNYFSMVTTVGTPQTVAAQELRIECMSRRMRRPRSITLR